MRGGVWREEAYIILQRDYIFIFTYIFLVEKVYFTSIQRSSNVSQLHNSPRTCLPKMGCCLSDDSKNPYSEPLIDDEPPQKPIIIDRPKIIYKNWAFKQGHSRKNWTKRFVILSSGSLAYYVEVRALGFASGWGWKRVLRKLTHSLTRLLTHSLTHSLGRFARVAN